MPVEKVLVFVEIASLHGFCYNGTLKFSILEVHLLLPSNLYLLILMEEDTIIIYNNVQISRKLSYKAR